MKRNKLNSKIDFKSSQNSYDGEKKNKYLLDEFCMWDVPKLLAEVEYAYKNLCLVSMNGEIWESCTNYDGLYEVSNMGRVKSIFRIVYCKDGRQRKIQERILKQAVAKKKQKSKYLFVGLSKAGIIYTEDIHRLIASSFKIKGDGNCVIHIDGDKFNNNIYNLKNATHNEKGKLSWSIGNNYSVNIGKFGGNAQSAKAVQMNDMNGNKISIFNSRIEAANFLIENGFAKKQFPVNIISNINKASKGIFNYAYGHKWSNLILIE